MSKFTDDIKKFHEKFFLLPLVDKPDLLPISMMRFRAIFLQEELDEFLKGYSDADLEACADALVDIVYVALGTAYLMGLPFDDLWDEVQKANMNKIRAVKVTKRGTTFDVIKPKGWQPPNLKHLLGIENGENKKETS